MFLILVTFGLSGQQIEKEIRELSEDLVQAYQKLPNARYRNTIAIPDFVDAGPIAEQYRLGFAFSELMTEYLIARREEFRVIERKRLEEILREQKLQLAGLVQENSTGSGICWELICCFSGRSLKRGIRST
jgi:hypothetical protein